MADAVRSERLVIEVDGGPTPSRTSGLRSFSCVSKPDAKVRAQRLEESEHLSAVFHDRLSAWAHCEFYRPDNCRASKR